LRPAPPDRPAQRASPLPRIQQIPAAGPALQKGDRRLAEQLVFALDGLFDPAALQDDHRERIREFIAAKAEGRTVHFEELPAPAASES
jgi:non-homologous end joining protein Ku